MRMTIEIDDALLIAAMRVTGAKTKREAVEFGLRTLLRLREQAEIRRLRGTVQWDGDLEATRRD